jgi:N-acetylneuraminic acid mutarotase
MMSKRAAAWLLGALALTTAACGSSTKSAAPSTTTVPPSTTAPPTTTTTTVPADAGTWSLIPYGPNPVGSPSAWTGAEVLVARAGCCDDSGSVDLAAYDPAVNSWHQLPLTPLTPRSGAAGAWTGTEMVVAGGHASPDGLASDATPVTDGAAWHAATNTWRAIAPMPTTLPGNDPTAVWTGTEVLVWSSAPATPDTNGREVVLAYNPSTNTWRTLPSSGLTPRQGAVTIWTGHQLVVWGGLNFDFTYAYPDGARLDPLTGTWQRLPAAPVPARGFAGAAWSGRDVLLWGGQTVTSVEIRASAGFQSVGQGAAYDPVTNRWRALPLSPLRAKSSPSAVWTGHFFIVIGGSANGVLPAPGPGAAAYDPATNSWTTLPAAPSYPPPDPNGPTGPADQREGAFAVWTGTAVVLVGGGDYVDQGPRSDGIRWTPAG